MLAALGPQMTALAAARTAGALPYNVTPEHTARARAILGPDKWLCVEQKVLMSTDATKARRVARQTLAFYMPCPITATTGCAWASVSRIWPMGQASGFWMPWLPGGRIGARATHPGAFRCRTAMSASRRYAPTDSRCRTGAR